MDKVACEVVEFCVFVRPQHDVMNKAQVLKTKTLVQVLPLNSYMILEKMLRSLSTNCFFCKPGVL